MKIKGEDRTRIIAEAIKSMTYYEHTLLAEMLGDTINNATGLELEISQLSDALDSWARGYNPEG